MRCYASTMRKTVTLDPDTEALIEQMMRERCLTFKQAVALSRTRPSERGTDDLPR